MGRRVMGPAPSGRLSAARPLPGTRTAGFSTAHASSIRLRTRLGRSGDYASFVKVRISLSATMPAVASSKRRKCGEARWTLKASRSS